MKTLSRSLFLAVLFSGLLAALEAQTATVIPDSEAAQHVGQQATVEGTMVKVFTSKNGNTFLNFGAAYPVKQPDYDLIFEIRPYLSTERWRTKK